LPQKSQPSCGLRQIHTSVCTSTQTHNLTHREMCAQGTHFCAFFTFSSVSPGDPVNHIRQTTWFKWHKLPSYCLFSFLIIASNVPFPGCNGRPATSKQPILQGHFPYLRMSCPISDQSQFLLLEKEPVGCWPNLSQ